MRARIIQTNYKIEHGLTNSVISPNNSCCHGHMISWRLSLIRNSLDLIL